MSTIFMCLIGYGLGSLSSAILIARIRGLSDPRQVGSGNPGASNMLRIGGRQAAIGVLLGDSLKAMLPMCLALWLSVPEAALGYVLLSSVLGHVYPIFFRFRGGKGVATALGGLLILNGNIALVLLACWAVVVAISRYVSLGSVLAAALLPIITGYLAPIHTIPMLGIALLICLKHHTNIQRLIHGDEAKL